MDTYIVFNEAHQIQLFTSGFHKAILAVEIHNYLHQKDKWQLVLFQGLSN